MAKHDTPIARILIVEDERDSASLLELQFEMASPSVEHIDETQGAGRVSSEHDLKGLLRLGENLLVIERDQLLRRFRSQPGVFGLKAQLRARRVHPIAQST